MRVGSGPSIAHATSSSATRREVEPTRTAVSREQIRGAIRRALETVDGARPSDKLVETLTAHASLETASGDRMYNFNFGGIKGVSPSGATAVYKTREVLGGKDVTIRDGFRAYASLDEGALDYVRTMKGRFSSALEPAARGDVAGFASALKRSGYYTASEADYSRGLASLLGVKPEQHGGATSIALAPHARDLSLTGVSSLSSTQLSRVEDVLDQSRWLEALGPSPSHARRASDEDQDDS